MHAAIYSLLTMRPDPERIDVLCVGVAAKAHDGQWHLYVPASDAKLARAGFHEAATRLPTMAGHLRELLAQCSDIASARLMLGQLGSSLQLHQFEGVVCYADLAGLDEQLRAVAAESVLPPPAGARRNERTPTLAQRPRLQTRLRQHFDTMGILGRSPDDLADHKVVRNYPVSLQHGLTAEFALKNGAMHITETIDFEVADDSVRTKIFEAQAKCLVMREARDSFGQNTQCYVVVAGGSAQHAARSVDLLSTTARLFSVENAGDMSDYLERIARAAGLSRTLPS